MDNNMLTVRIYDTSYEYDYWRKKARERYAKHPYSVSPCYCDKTFRINPKWHKCYAGREEYV